MLAKIKCVVALPVRGQEKSGGAFHACGQWWGGGFFLERFTRTQKNKDREEKYVRPLTIEINTCQ